MPSTVLGAEELSGNIQNSFSCGHLYYLAYTLVICYISYCLENIGDLNIVRGQAGTISGKEWRRQGEAQGETFLGILEEQQDTSLGRAFNFPKIP